jgi:hypothetical protein
MPQKWNDVWADWLKLQKKKGVKVITKEMIQTQMQVMVKQFELHRFGFMAKFGYRQADKARKIAQQMWVERDKILKQMAGEFETIVREYLSKNKSLEAASKALKAAIKKAGEKLVKEAVTEAAKKGIKEAVEAIGRQMITKMTRSVFKKGLRGLGSWMDCPLLPGPIDAVFALYDFHNTPYTSETTTVIGPGEDYVVEQYVDGIFFGLLGSERPFVTRMRMEMLLDALGMQEEDENVITIEFEEADRDEDDFDDLIITIGK